MEELGTRGVESESVVGKVSDWDVVVVPKRKDDVVRSVTSVVVLVVRVEVLVVVNSPGPLLEPLHVKSLKH